MNMNMRNINNISGYNHPLITKNETYFLDRKLLSIHSTDRDKSKHPNSNDFEITIPGGYDNVQSIRLIDYSMPHVFYEFSKNYCNTKMTFSYNSGNNISIEIPEGNYNADELTNTIQEALNKGLYDATPSVTDKPFVCKYDKVQNKIIIGSRKLSFKLKFDIKEPYDCDFNKSANIYEQSNHWGLGYYLGFDKNEYSSTTISGLGGSSTYEESLNGKSVSYENVAWLTSDGGTSVDFIEPDNSVKLRNDDVIYLELDKYNSLDEVYPGSNNTNGYYNNDGGNRINGSFAKIPISYNKQPSNTNHRIPVPSNVSFYDSPISKLTRFRIKFRYHDGRLVDFKSNDHSLTIEINMLKDNPINKKIVDVPKLWNA